MFAPLEGKRSVITGASGDIGRAIARAFADAGSDLVLHYARRAEEARGAAEYAQARGRRALVFEGRLDDSSTGAALMRLAADELGGIDVLVNNAGVTRDGLLFLQPEADWRKVLDVNLFGTMTCCREAIRYMLRLRQGAIVNVSSLSGLTGLPGQAAYSASKAAIIGLTKSLAQEMGAKGIRVNAVAPGLIESEWVKNAKGRPNPQQIPLGRLGQPSEVASAVLFLASHLSSYVTGTVLNVSGGLYTGQ
jgi:3-oxoacyl-[acyl-carrier protein] reductase